MKIKCFSFSSISLLAALLLIGARAGAANFTTTTVQADPANFNAAIWQATAPLAGNTYEALAGALIRTVSGGTTAVFAGDRLTLDGNGTVTAASTAQLRMKTSTSASTITIADFHMNGGVLNNGTASTAPTIQGGTMTIDATSTIDNGSTIGTTIDATRAVTIASTLQGSGRLIIQTCGTNLPVNITGTANTYSGTWQVTGGFLKGTGNNSLGTGNFLIGGANPTRLEIMYDISTFGTLTLTNSAAMILHQNCTFSNATINGTSLTVGTHPYAELAANFAAYFPAGGSGSITIPAPAPPFAPLNVSAVGSDTLVALNWSAAVNASGYFINRSTTSGGSYTTVGSAGSTNFNDTTVVNGTTYYYVIVATNSLGSSTNSTEVVSTPNVLVTGITAAGGTNQIALSWYALPAAASYTVLRSPTLNGTYAPVASGLTDTNYLDALLPDGTAYFYRISAALNPSGISGQSASVSASTAPSAPVLSAVLFASTVIRVGWTTNNPVVLQYYLQRSPDGTTFSPLINLAGNAASYTNASLTLSSTYYYRVQASNSAGLSAFSNIAGTNTPPIGTININFGAGGNASAGGLNSPNPPGYLGDIGELFGDRTNGYFYGWSTIGGTNITRDARWRQNPISPDLRYDTFIHFMKANNGASDPALGAVWEIALPNGFYRVHFVSGDSDNLDSTFIFDVEGVISPTYVPSATPPSAHWGEFTVSCAVNDGRLTIKSATGAVNTKISFIDIYPDIPVPPVISVNPSSVTLEQNRRLAMSVSLSQGSTPLVYQWYNTAGLVSGATNATLVIPHVQLSDASDYYLIVTNYGGSATSAVATLTVTPDTTPPFLVSVSSLDGITIGLCFNEEIDVGTASDASNYAINANTVNITNVIIRPDGRTVALQVDTVLSGNFQLEIFAMTDLAGQFADYSSTIGAVVPGFTVGDVGSPQFPGRNFTCDGTNIELVGGGADYWNTNDQAYLATTPITGDFDVSVQVSALAGGNTITKAVLLARETLNTESAGVHVSVNPVPPGRNLIEMGVRATTSASTIVAATNYSPANIPNAWLRLQRVGNIFTGYHSSDGINWFILGQSNETYSSSMVIGMAVTAHDNTLLATGTFSGFKIVQSSADLAVAKIATPNPVQLGADSPYLITVTNTGPTASDGVTVTDVLPPGVSFVSATASQGGCTFLAGTVTCNLGTVASGGAATVTVTVHSPTAGLLTNTVSVSATTTDSNLANNSATAVARVVTMPSLVGLLNVGGTSVSASFQTEVGSSYEIQFKHHIDDPTWTPLPPTIVGDGTVKTFTDSSPANDSGFYRIVVH